MTDRARHGTAFGVAAATVALFLVALILLAGHAKPAPRAVAAVPRPIVVRRIIVTRRVVVVRDDGATAATAEPQRVITLSPAPAPVVAAPAPAPAPAAPAPLATHAS